MAFKIEIISDNALRVTNTTTGDVEISQPKLYIWYDEEALKNGLVKFKGLSNPSSINIKNYYIRNPSYNTGYPIEECVDSEDTTFTIETFRAFASENLGKLNGGATSKTTVNELSDLPKAIGGVIQLNNYWLYEFLGNVDLKGNRLQGGVNTTIIGGSSESSTLTSTGIGVGVALISSDYTLAIRHITFKDVDTCLNLDGLGNTMALDWTGVNFENIPNIGTVKDFSNFIFTKGAFLTSKNLTIDGTFGTFAINQSLLLGDGLAGNIINIPSTSICNIRFRIIYSSIIAFGSTIGINVDNSATIPVENYILDTVNFSGVGTYLSGVNYTDNRARFINCIGITNTSEIGNYYMSNNAIETVITAIDTPVKILGTTTPSAINQKFSHTNNRLTYTGALTGSFEVDSVISLSGSSNNEIGLYIAKNGVVLTESEMYTTLPSGGRVESITIQTIVNLNENDYIEIFAENSTGTNNITAEHLNTTVKSLN